MGHGAWGRISNCGLLVANFKIMRFWFLHLKPEALGSNELFFLFVEYIAYFRLYCFLYFKLKYMKYHLFFISRILA